MLVSATTSSLNKIEVYIPQMNNCHESLSQKSLIIITVFKNKKYKKKKNKFVRGFIFDFMCIFSRFETAHSYSEYFSYKGYLAG